MNAMLQEVIQLILRRFLQDLALLFESEATVLIRSSAKDFGQSLEVLVCQSTGSHPDETKAGWKSRAPFGSYLMLPNWQ